MTDADREIRRLISYIRSCQEAGIDCTVTIDKRITHGVLNAFEEIQQYREIGTVEECREAVGKQKAEKPRILVSRGGKGGKYCVCPKCERVTGKYIPFCRLCGQAIDWNEEE